MFDTDLRNNKSRASLVRFWTPISIEECRHYLANAIDAEIIAWNLSGIAGTKPILGKLRGDDFRLQKRIRYRNPCRPFFYGKFIPAPDGGTIVEGRFRMHPFVHSFMGCWCLFALTLLLTVVGSLAAGKMAIGDSVLTIISILAVSAIGIAIVAFGQWLSRHHKRFIVAVLTTTLGVETWELKRGRS